VGGCQDATLIIDFIGAYLFPNGERTIQEFAATGISLGGKLFYSTLRRVKLNDRPCDLAFAPDWYVVHLIPYEPDDRTPYTNSSSDHRSPFPYIRKIPQSPSEWARYGLDRTTNPTVHGPFLRVLQSG